MAPHGIAGSVKNVVVRFRSLSAEMGPPVRRLYGSRRMSARPSRPPTRWTVDNDLGRRMESVARLGCQARSRVAALAGRMVLPLKWRQVDFATREVRLYPGTTKNGEGERFPMTRELRTLLEQQERSPKIFSVGMTGHRTRSVLERYNIVSVDDLRDAAKRFDSVTGTISGTLGESSREPSQAGCAQVLCATIVSCLR